DEKALAPLVDGPHQLNLTVEQTFHQTEPFAAGPVTVHVPVSTPLELFAKDTIVDEFKVDPAQRAAERAAVLAARVLHDDKGNVEVRVKTAALPVALAVQVVLTQGQAEQKVGTRLVDAGQKPRWSAASAWRKPKFTGTVDVHLRPDQSAAENRL